MINGLMFVDGVAIGVGATDDGIERLGDGNVFDKGDSINGVGVGGDIVLILTGVSRIGVLMVGNNDGFESKRVSSK